MKRATGARAPVPNLPDPPPAYEQGWASSLVQSLRQGFADVIHGHTIKPIIQVEALRNADQVTMTVTVRDSDRRVKAIEYTKREGATAITGWVDTWDFPTGTIGTDAELIRAEVIDIPPGMDSAAEWRVKWRDQQGTEHIEGGPVPIANLASFTVIRRFPFTIWNAADGATAYFTTEYLQATGTAQERFVATLIIPVGATLSAARAYGYRNGPGDFVRFVPQVVEDGMASANLGVAVDHSTTGWQELEVTMTHMAAADETFTALLLMDADTDAGHVRAGYLECEYSVPDYTTT